jgi:hypothetical protein
VASKIEGLPEQEDGNGLVGDLLRPNMGPSAGAQAPKEKRPWVDLGMDVMSVTALQRCEAPTAKRQGNQVNHVRKVSLVVVGKINRHTQGDCQ